jgi:hypothetical protein
MIFLGLTMVLLAAAIAFAGGNNRNEVWSIDQSDSAGKNYGGAIYIWNANDLEKSNKKAVPERVDLGGVAAALCLAQTGAHPVRPHMLTMNKSNTHAMISFVASGHVLFMNAATRAQLPAFAPPSAPPASVRCISLSVAG